MRFTLVACSIGILCALACNRPTTIQCQELSLAENAKEEFGVEEWPADWPDRSVSCSIGEYVVVTPIGESDVDHVMLLRDGKPLFYSEGGVESIFENGRPVLSVTDSDNNGTFDRVN